MNAARPSLRRLDLHYIVMQMGYWAMFAAICAYLAALLGAAIGLLREALLIQAGAQAPSGPELAPVAALPQKRLLAWARELEELRRATQFNVGVGHLCGALCAALSR